MDGAVDESRIANRGTTWLVALAALKLGLHLLTNGGYDYFRDELYYITCSDHLAAGYVDHPPLSIFLLALSRALLGDSLHAIRLLPALAGAALVALTALMACELGGGRFAQLLAGLAVLVAPVYLVTDNFYSMNAFEPVFWALCAYLVMRIVNTGDSRLWLVFGVVVGLGLENKHSMLFLGFGLFVGLLLTEQRRFLVDKWLWIGVAVAGLLFVPNLIWETRHQWPTLEFMRNAQAYKNAQLSPMDFFVGQIITLHPLLFPIWVMGLCYYLFSAAGRGYRLLGLAYVAIFILFVIENAKVYYLAAIYPMLLAAGALVCERLSARSGRAWLRPAIVSLLVIGGAVAAPMALPVLPPETFIRYANALGINERVKRIPSEKLGEAELPQYFADMFGWNELVAAVAQIYNRLPETERAGCAIFAQNYGEAGAIDLLGKRYGLPHAISPHNNYWLWGARGYSGEVVIAVGASEKDLTMFFDSVTQVGVTHCRYCMPFENDRPIFLCRHLKQPLDQVWPRLKFYL
jgi:4-amino-4-deoxy-L-arabinose transferase-like glycosyltransferase